MQRDSSLPERVWQSERDRGRDQATCDNVARAPRHLPTSAADRYVPAARISRRPAGVSVRRAGSLPRGITLSCNCCRLIGAGFSKKGIHSAARCPRQRCPVSARQLTMRPANPFADVGNLGGDSASRPDKRTEWRTDLTQISPPLAAWRPADILRLLRRPGISRIGRSGCHPATATTGSPVV